MAKQLICTLCGYTGSPKKKTKGNFLIEVILWLFFIIPGLIYSIWRLSNKQETCPKCGNASMIPSDSPQGQKLAAEQRSNPSISRESLEPEKNPNKTRNIMIGVVVGVVILLIVIISTSMDDARERSAKEKDVNVQPALHDKAVVQNLPDEPKARMEALVKSIGDYEVTVWDSKGNIAKATTKPPFEVFVNDNKKIASCHYAKNIAVDIMKKLYTDEVTKDKVARVLFTSLGHLRVSLGSEDGAKMDWSTAGPTNFWTVMMKYKSYEDETGTLSQRTWGKYIADDCK